jgi:hypothetical protein
MIPLVFQKELILFHIGYKKELLMDRFGSTSIRVI